jgi:formyltetrahydrofolate deformylase
VGAEPATFTGRLLIGCPDRPGIVAAVSGFLYERGANIVSSHQYSSDPTGGRFFLRIEFFLEDAASAGEDAASAGEGAGRRAGEHAGGQAGAGGQPRARGPERARAEFVERFAADVAARFEMDWRVRWWGERSRIAVLVSRHEHCLLELLWRSRRSELDGEIALVISNHPDLEREVTNAGIPYHHVPVDAGAKPDAEAAMLELLRGNADVLVLARYMQILSGEFLERVDMPAINIHHSFLPAFAGANPYQQAHDRGVKLIGATAHYVTEELDAGPIIEQDVVRVDHHQSAGELERVGRDVERRVLARAVALHLDERVIVDGPRTIVF